MHWRELIKLVVTARIKLSSLFWQTMSNTKRLLVYIVPVTVLSFALNTPKFMEVTLTKNNGTNEVDPSKTRRDPNFVFWWEDWRMDILTCSDVSQVHPLSHLAPHPHHRGPPLHRPRLHEPPDIPGHQAEQTGAVLIKIREKNPPS